jgi:hypothetical protein
MANFKEVSVADSSTLKVVKHKGMVCQLSFKGQISQAKPSTSSLFEGKINIKGCL